MKKALGKGIKAFIPQEYGILKNEVYAELDIDQLRPNPLQPRLKFEEKAIQELAQSIREAGVLQPIVVVQDDGHYKILIGERRWRAAQKAGLNKIPALIRDIPRDEQLEISLVENLQREQLNPVEIALGYKRMIEELGYTQEEIAEKVGKDRASVANFLRILKLPDVILDSMQNGELSMGHAKALLALEDSRAQIEAANRIKRKSLSVREAEHLVAKVMAKPASSKKRSIDPNLEAVQEELLKALGAKVVISGTPKSGVVRIFYFSLDELNRIHDLIKGART